MSSIFAHTVNIADDKPAFQLCHIDGHPSWVRCLLNPAFTKRNPHILKTRDEYPQYFNQLIEKTKRELENPKPRLMSLPPQALFKTELCRNFMASGCCPYGLHCKFAHGHEQRRIIMRHPKFKTVTCRHFLKHGTCPYGERCYFVHEWDEENAIKRNEQCSIYYKHFLRFSRVLEDA